MRSAAVALIAVSSLVGCGSSPDAIARGQEFTLAPGGSAVVSGGGPRVGFEGVREDSRCPSDVQCIRAGEVIADVTIGKGSSSRVSMQPGESVSSGRFRLHLVDVKPYPKSDRPVEPSQYRATFLVDTEPDR